MSPPAHSGDTAQRLGGGTETGEAFGARLSAGGGIVAAVTERAPQEPFGGAQLPVDDAVEQGGVRPDWAAAGAAVGGNGAGEGSLLFESHGEGRAQKLVFGRVGARAVPVEQERPGHG